MAQVHNENREKKCTYYFFFPRRFWVTESRHSETIFAKKKYTSIAACVAGGGVSSRMTGCKNFDTQVEQVAGSPGDADQCVKDTTGCGLVVVVVELR